MQKIMSYMKRDQQAKKRLIGSIIEKIGVQVSHYNKNEMLILEEERDN